MAKKKESEKIHIQAAKVHDVQAHGTDKAKFIYTQ